MAKKTATEKTIEMPKNGEFCWTEIATDNLETSRDFYQEVFGWQYKKSGATAEDNVYLEFGTNSDKQFGGMFEMKPEWYGGNPPTPHINIYVAVDDADETASKALDLGGKIVAPPAVVPNVGRICQIEDPSGARFFIITLKR